MPRRLPVTSRRRSRWPPTWRRPRAGGSWNDIALCRPERSEGPHDGTRIVDRSARSFAALRMTPILAGDLQYLRSPAAIRERAAQVLKYVEDGRSAWWSVDANGLEAAVQATLAVTRKRFANPAAIPFHSRWRHFEAGGHDRWAALAPRLAGLPREEIARRRVDLAVVSV